MMTCLWYADSSTHFNHSQQVVFELHSSGNQDIFITHVLNPMYVLLFVYNYYTHIIELISYIPYKIWTKIVKKDERTDVIFANHDTLTSIHTGWSSRLTTVVLNPYVFQDHLKFWWQASCQICSDGHCHHLIMRLTKSSCKALSFSCCLQY